MTKTAEKDAGISVSDQWLKDFLDKGGKAQSATGTPVDAQNVDSFLEKVAAPVDKSSKQNELHKKAVKAGAGDTTQEDAAKAIKEQERIDALRLAEEKKQQGKVQQAVYKAGRSVNSNVLAPGIEKAGGVVDYVSSASTAGGIGLLLVILIFLLFVIVQVNSQGDTRLKQFWYMLNGRAHLTGRVDIAKQDATGSGVAQQASGIAQGIGAAIGGVNGTGAGIAAGIQAVTGLSDYRTYV